MRNAARSYRPPVSTALIEPRSAFWDAAQSFLRPMPRSAGPGGPTQPESGKKALGLSSSADGGSIAGGVAWKMSAFVSIHLSLRRSEVTRTS